MVSDSGGFSDKSFNETSHKGLLDAEKKLGIERAQLESESDTDYTANIDSLIGQDCNLIVTVGYLLADATYDAAKENPDVNFAIVDYSYDPEEYEPLDNVKSLVFNAAQSSFLTGYVAAGMSETKVVGTFGGEKIPTVTIFMDGYAEGVQYYNQEKGEDVQVRGWDREKRDGTFIDSFKDKNKAKNTTNNLISQDADVIHPVAGEAGLGTMEATRNNDATVVWVDTDGCVSAEEYCSDIVTSSEKRLDLAVERTVTEAYNGKFDTTPYVGTLENDGVRMSSFHEFEDQVPAELKQEVEDLRQQLIDGEIELESPDQP